MNQLSNKRPLANLQNTLSDNNPLKSYNDSKPIKRPLASPNYYNKKKNFKKALNDENLTIDPTRTIEEKIKNIQISKTNTFKESKLITKPINNKQPKAVKNRSKQVSLDYSNYYQVSFKLPPGVQDFDLTQLNNVNAEPYYAYDIFCYLMEKEKTTKCQKYIHSQKEISESMRAILVDWLVEVQEEFELNHETLYQAIKILDHYLMIRKISRVNFQLLGITAMFISAKIEERMYPAIEDFIFITNDTYSKEDVIEMEVDILKSLDFEINYPLSYSFLRRFSRCSSQTMEVLTLSRFILETSLMDHSLIDELDSKMAAAALLVALKMKNLTWNPTLEFYSTYKESDLIDLANRLNELIKDSGKFKKCENIRTKYSDSTSFFGVATLKPLPIIN